MSKLSEELAVEDGLYEDQDIGAEDYGFILGPDGELKSLFLPDVLPFKQPKNVYKILKMFGIRDPEQLDNDTLH
jgi:hypothetical protein